MVNAYRTVTLPVNPGAAWVQAWPAKDPLDNERDYRIDATDYLTQAGRYVVNTVSVTVDASLTVADYTADIYGITFHVTGGVVGTQPAIEALLQLDNGDVLTVAATIPIRALVISTVTVLPPPISLTAPGVVSDAGGILMDAGGVVQSA